MPTMTNEIDDADPDPLLECIAQARREGRDVVRSLVRDGWITPQDVADYQASIRDEG